MERFETEEQQVEAIKRFWKENGTAIIVGAVIGLGGLWGWRYYNDYKIAGMEASSEQYQTTIESMQQENGLTDAAKLVAENPDNGYSLITAMLLAQQEVENGNLEQAAGHLQLVASNAPDQSIAALASIRLARVQIAQDKLDDALATLDKVEDPAFSGKVQAVKGDIYQAQQLFDKARAAYSAALEKDSNDNQVKMKLDNLALAANG